MSVVAVVFGSCVGFLSGVVAYIAFEATFWQAALLYATCGFAALLLSTAFIVLKKKNSNGGLPPRNKRGKAKALS